MNIKVRALVFEDKNSKWWSAQCLEYDITMQANSLQDLIYEITRVLTGYMVVSKELGIKPFSNLGSAPQMFWNLYDRSKTSLNRDPVPMGTIESFEITPDLRLAELQPA